MVTSPLERGGTRGRGNVVSRIQEYRRRDKERRGNAYNYIKKTMPRKWRLERGALSLTFKV
jgi:hypothetical protein